MREKDLLNRDSYTMFATKNGSKETRYLLLSLSLCLVYCYFIELDSPKYAQLDIDTVENSHISLSFFYSFRQYDVIEKKTCCCLSSQSQRIIVYISIKKKSAPG